MTAGPKPNIPLADHRRACGSYRTNLSWHVFQTRPFHEEEGEKSLENSGFKVFMPRSGRESLSLSQPSRRVPMLFPTYGFVRFDPDRDDWIPLRYLPGVRKIFMSPEFTPLTVPAKFIRDLVRMCFLSRLGEQIRPVIKPGTLVRVRSGLLRGETFVVSRMTSSERANLVVHIMGADRDVSFHVDNLAIVS